MRISSILKALCPSCHKGRVVENGFAIRARCPECGYNLHPEPGFYLGAMMVGFLLTAVLTIPPMVVLKLMEVDIKLLVVFPFVEFLFVGTFLAFYSRIFWLHLEHRMTEKLENK